MKNFLFLFLLTSWLCWAQSSSGGYTVNIHVTSSEWIVVPSTVGPVPAQRLKVVIGAKKYELEGTPKGGQIAVLVLGDYKAKLVEDIHKNSYEISRTYELQFSDGKTRRFDVVGVMD